MSKKIKAIRMRPDEAPEEIQIENELRALQAEVGGYIETLYLADGVTAIVNEEGRLEGLRPNCMFRAELLVGPVVLVGVKGDRFCSIPEGYESLWIDALERARERALPLIREWDRGI